MSIFERYQARYESSREEDMSLQEYLDLCKRSDGLCRAAERMLAPSASRNSSTRTTIRG
jgi:serine protein kinase